MFRAVLVANRGEIARGIIRGCQSLGVRAVAVCSQADREAPHVRQADEAVRLGPAPARESYLAVERVIEAARRAGALLFKVIAHGPDRPAALARLAAALEATVVEGVRTTLPFLRRVLAYPDVRRGVVHTQMVEQGAFNA